jgi:cobalt-zinc-cadmium efflux system protein
MTNLHNHSHSNHNHSHTEHTDGDGIKSAFFLNLFFAIIEIIGGLLTNSFAILSDALHDMGDTAAIGLSFFLEKIAQKKRDERYSYGYKRVSLLAGLLSTIVLLFGSSFIIYGAIHRLYEPGEVNSAGMFLLSILGITINGMAFFRLNNSDKANIKAVRLHLLEDVLGWVAVFFGSMIIYFTGYTWIDPALSLLIALFILYNAYINLRSFTRIFLQGLPSGIEENKLISELEEIEGVVSLHDLHIWSMDGTYNIMSVHLVVKDETNKDEIIAIRTKAKAIIRNCDIKHETIEIGYCSVDCEYLDC